MKYFTIILLFLYSCSNYDIEQKNVKSINYVSGISKIEYNGHSYILFNQYQKSSLIHDPDCNCNKYDCAKE